MDRAFLELCGFEPAEIDSEGPRVERALARWGMGPGEVRDAEARVRRYYDVRLLGVRKFLGIWLKEFADLTLSREEGKTVVYFSFPPVGQIAASLATIENNLYTGIPDTLAMAVIGSMFGRLNPILEEAEKKWLPRGQAHCAIPQIRLAAIMRGHIPVPDLLVATGTTCDQVGKTDEIIGELYGPRVVHLDAGFSMSDAPPPHVEPARVRFMAEEMKNAVEVIRQVTGHTVTEKTLTDGRHAFRGLRAMYHQIGNLLTADPIPFSSKDFGMVGLTTTSYLRRVMREGPAAAQILVSEIKQRIERGEGVVPKGAPRVFILYPHFADPAVTEVVESCGLAIAASARSQTTDQAPPQYEDVWERAAEITLRSGGSVTATVSLMKDLIETWKVDGVIINTISVCRWFNFWPLKLKQVVERDLGVPVLALEHDPYDSRDYTPEQFRSRVEPFAEMLKARRRG